MRSMKIWHFCLLCSGMIIESALARDVQETVLMAHKLFEQGQIDQALELYDSIEKKGAATWYNKGMCYYKKGDYLNALVCWKKAERDARWGELPDIQYNIDQAYKELNIQPDNTFIHSLYRRVMRYLSLLTFYGWQLLFLAEWMLLLLLAARLARGRRYGMLSILSLLVVLLAAALYMKHDICNTQYGIVVKNNLVVYAGPDKAFHELGNLTRAYQITVCENQENWLKVRDDVLVGWVCHEGIALV